MSQRESLASVCMRLSEHLVKALECKQHGKECFLAASYADAAGWYSKAIEHDQQYRKHNDNTGLDSSDDLPSLHSLPDEDDSNDDTDFTSSDCPSSSSGDSMTTHLGMMPNFG